MGMLDFPLSANQLNGYKVAKVGAFAKNCSQATAKSLHLNQNAYDFARHSALCGLLLKIARLMGFDGPSHFNCFSARPEC
jgi:hypothetical protein